MKLHSSIYKVPKFDRYIDLSLIVEIKNIEYHYNSKGSHVCFIVKMNTNESTFKKTVRTIYKGGNYWINAEAYDINGILITMDNFYDIFGTELEIPLRNSDGTMVSEIELNQETRIPLIQAWSNYKKFSELNK